MKFRINTIYEDNPFAKFKLVNEKKREEWNKALRKLKEAVASLGKRMLLEQQEPNMKIVRTGKFYYGDWKNK